MRELLLGFAAYIGLMLCIMLGVAFFVFKAPPPDYKDPDDETDEEKADRNFFEYMDKVNKDIDRV